MNKSFLWVVIKAILYILLFLSIKMKGINNNIINYIDKSAFLYLKVPSDE
jgi:hypothetical protein